MQEIVTPLALDEYNGPRGDFTRICSRSVCSQTRHRHEDANVAELLMSPKGAFITGSDFLIDGGATATYFYGPLNPIH